jgi:hypothetical protein
MENVQIKTVNSNLTRHESNITKIESNANLITSNIKNESGKISIKKRKLDKDFHNETISKNNNKPLQKSRRDFIEENKVLDDVTYYFEKGKLILDFIVFLFLFNLLFNIFF